MTADIVRLNFVTRSGPSWLIFFNKMSALSTSSSSVRAVTNAASLVASYGVKPLDVTGAFKTFISMPTITKAKFLPIPIQQQKNISSPTTASTAGAPLSPIWVCSSVKNVQYDESRTWHQTYIPTHEGKYIPMGYALPLDTLAQLASPSRKFMATIRNAPSKDGSTKSTVPNYMIEITDTDPSSPSHGRVLHSITTSGVHGRMFLTGNFGGFAWSLSEQMICYMAEPKVEERKNANYFPSPEEEEKQRANASANPMNNGAAIKGTEYELREDWGEQLVGITKPRPFIMRWGPADTQPDSAKIYTVKGIPDDVSAGQCIFSGWEESKYRRGTTASDGTPSSTSSPSLFDEGIYLTIYPNHQGLGGRKLGMIYFNTRESKIAYLSAKYIVDPAKEAEKKRIKDRAAKVKKDVEERKRRENGLPERTEEEEKALLDAELSQKHKESQREKRINRLIILTPNDFSAQSPRLDGFSPPQLIYLTTEEKWHHCSGSILKTWIALPATLGMFMKLVDAPYVDEEDDSDKNVTNDANSTSGNEATPARSFAELESSITPTTPSSSILSAPSPDPEEFHTHPRIHQSNTHEMVPIVQYPSTISSFPGLWPVGNVLPSSDSLVFDEKHILIASSWRSQQALLLCCDEDDSLSRIPLPIDAPDGASFSLFDVDRTSGRLLVGVSNLATPEALYVGELRKLKSGETVSVGADFLPVCIVHKDGTAFTSSFDGPADDEEGGEEQRASMDDDDASDGAIAQIRWTRVIAPSAPLHPEAARRLASCRMEIIQIDVPEKESDYPDGIGKKQLPFEAVLLTSANVEKSNAAGIPLPPLLAFPHGGPHGATPTSFIPHIGFMASIGFSILMINYRGSTAFGQAALETLPGKCGQQDVADCITAIETIIQRTGKNKICDRNNIHIQGGSHGGFLVTHLIGQAPNLFQTASARNPVCNIAAMISCSDIPDWCYFEGLGYPYNPKLPPNADEYKKLFQVSPIAHVHNAVNTPLLMLLGGSDKRVPPSQAHDYAKLLKGVGGTVRILYYPDGKHPLAETIAMEGDVWTNMALWALKRYDGTDFELLPMPALD
jgi:predicted esterase